MQKHYGSENIDYIKGLVLTDGNITWNNGIRVSSAYPAFVDNFINHGYKVRIQEGNYRYADIKIGNTEFAEVGLLFQRGKKTYDFDASVLQIEDDFQFLSGVIDGDGCIHKRKMCINVYCSGEYVKKLICDIYDRNNIEYKIYFSKCWVIRVLKKSSIRLLCDRLDLRMPHKRHMLEFRKLNDYHLSMPLPEEVEAKYIELMATYQKLSQLPLTK